MSTVQEVAAGIYRIHTAVTVPSGRFSFNQYLLLDEQPLLFHTGPRALFPQVREAIASVMRIEKLRFVGFSHFENDECGALNQLLAVAPDALPLCGRVNAMINGDAFDRPAHALGDSDVLSLGTHQVRWFDAPHMPHAWECGYLMEQTTRTLLCGDLFTQGGEGEAALTTSDVLGPSEAFRKTMDYYSHTKNARPMLARLAATNPTTLACMHGSAWQGNGAGLLSALAAALDGAREPMAAQALAHPPQSSRA